MFDLAIKSDGLIRLSFFPISKLKWLKVFKTNKQTETQWIKSSVQIVPVLTNQTRVYLVKYKKAVRYAYIRIY